MDDFMNKMGLGDPDPSNHRTGSMVQTKLLTGSKETNPTIGALVRRRMIPQTAVIYSNGSQECERAAQLSNH